MPTIFTQFKPLRTPENKLSNMTDKFFWDLPTKNYNHSHRLLLEAKDFLSSVMTFDLLN